MTTLSHGRHILMTADAVSDAWDHAASLSMALAGGGWSITLVTLGPAPRQDQFLPLLGFDDIDLEITALEPEWRDLEGHDRPRVMEYMASLEERLHPDIVHLNSFREACAGWSAPVLVSAHDRVDAKSRVWRDVAPSALWRDYAADIAAGLGAADRWVAPTAAFRDTVARLYAPPRAGDVIPRGIAPMEVSSAKAPIILAARHAEDEAASLHPLVGIDTPRDWTLRLADGLTRAERHASLREAGIFIAAAPHAPFGMAVLEAAAAGCALVLADLPSLRDAWDGAALFIDPRDQEATTAALNRLARDSGARETLQAAALRRASRYSLAAEADAYERLYREILARPARRPSARPLAFSHAWL